MSIYHLGYIPGQSLSEWRIGQEQLKYRSEMNNYAQQMLSAPAFAPPEPPKLQTVRCDGCGARRLEGHECDYCGGA